MNPRTLGARCGALCALFLVVMAGWPLVSTAQNTYALPMVLPASNAALTGFVRIINRTARAGTVRITAVDSDGESYGPVTLSLDAHETVNFNSRDLEQGNAAKGLPGGVGDGTGAWRLFLDTALSITPLAYIRTSDGFVTAMHDVAPETSRGARRYQVVFINPGANTRQVSRLRLINPGSRAANVEITGRDDAGDPAPGGSVRLTLAAWSSRTLTAQALEAGTGLDGRLGDGSGKWRLTVSSNVDIQVMSLLRSPTGHLANLSTAPVHVGVAPTGPVTEPETPTDPETPTEPETPTAGVGCADEAAFNALVAGKRIVTASTTIRFTGGQRISETFVGLATLHGSYTYAKTGPSTGTMRIRYDNGVQCNVSLSCTTPTTGRFNSRCAGISIREEVWRIIP